MVKSVLGSKATMNMSDTAQHDAFESDERYSWGEAAATPGTRAIFSRFSCGIHTLTGLPMSSALSTLVSVPSGTTMMSAPSRLSARRRLSSAPRMINTVDKENPATTRAHRNTTQLLNALPLMLLQAN